MDILQLGIAAVERGYVPDSLTRIAIRRLCRQRALAMQAMEVENVRADQRAFIESMRSEPIAPVPAKANEQHYELPPEFFSAVLGPHRKYSCCYWPDKSASLQQAEEASLRITCERAEIKDGLNILELGCGWGSLSLWMASQYPRSRVTAVSNSAPQRRFIESEASLRGLSNLRVITADMNEFSPPAADSSSGRYDRVVSVEMFEHMRNYEQLLARIASWLDTDGRLFIHIFCHRDQAYPYETEGTSNWMGKYFFTGGIMPSAGLLHQFADDMTVIGYWSWNGGHYQRTSDAWLAQLDRRRHEILPILKSVYGTSEALRWFHRWRIFFLAVSEMFGFSGGDEWFVSHYLFKLTHEVARSRQVTTSLPGGAFLESATA